MKTNLRTGGFTYDPKKKDFKRSSLHDYCNNRDITER